VPNEVAQAIVAEALSLQRSMAHLPALLVLDLAMRGRAGAQPDFGPPGPGSPLDPTSPFGALLAAAFDDQMTISGVQALSASPAAARMDAFEEFWRQRVMQAFAERYGLAL
jgi:hypothetical protein